MTGSASPRRFYLNVSNQTRYYIMCFVNGRATPPTPIIGPANDGGANGVAWATAFLVKTPTVRLYGSRLFGTMWADIALWEGPAPTQLALRGAVLTANASEPFGIGPSAGFKAAGDARPWKLAFGVRGNGTTSVGNSIWIADSVTGNVGTWQRVGPALTASEPWEAAGICPSHNPFFDEDTGLWVMIYHAYETMTLAHAAVATSPTPNGPYGNKRKVASPINSRIPFAATAVTDHATAAASPRLGEPYVLRQASPQAMEVVVPDSFEDGIVRFNRPLFGSYPSGEMAHVGSNKYDLSYIEKLPDGTYFGYVTGYGQHANTQLSEYTFEVSAPHYDGPWTPLPNGIAFSPWTAAGVGSTENPTAEIEVD